MMDGWNGKWAAQQTLFYFYAQFAAEIIRAMEELMFDSVTLIGYKSAYILSFCMSFHYSPAARKF
jgi:hypothetical protein